MDILDLKFSPLSLDFDLSNFDSDKEDINAFLLDNAWNYQEEHMANTYLFYKDHSNVLAFFCISNDCLNDRGFQNTTWNKFHRKQKIPNKKRIKQYPAIKVDRLGVHITEHKTGLAYELMDFIKGFSITDLKPACRLLLLDAINEPRQLKYYKNNGFNFLLDTDENSRTRIMYFDLKRIKED